MADFVTPSVRTFQVFPDIPPALRPLMEIARNLWWTWQPEAVELFRRLDRELWEQVYHNPVKLLGQIDQNKLISASRDEGFLAHLERVYEAFAGRWPELSQRTAQPPRSARFDWEDGATRVLVTFTAKGESKTTVAVSHERIADDETAARVKGMWRERLAELKGELEA